MANNTLHIYGQREWHDNAKIEGTRDALEKLKDAIQDALDSNRSKIREGKVNTYCADGEGYEISVYCVSPEQAETMILPYTAEHAKPTISEDKL